jgi:hypothetical protein
MSLPDNWTSGQSFTAAAENAVEAAANLSTNQLSGAASGVTLLAPTITGYTESVVTIGTVGATKTLSLVSGTVLTATLTASTATTFTMPTKVAGQSFVLLLKQAVTTGGGTATFTGVKWNATGAPTQTATAATMDIYSFISDGTDWYGSYAQGYTP